MSGAQSERIHICLLAREENNRLLFFFTTKRMIKIVYTGVFNVCETWQRPEALCGTKGIVL